MFVGGGYTWLRPVSLAKLLELKKAFPKATIVMGSQTVIGERKNVKMYHSTSELHVNLDQFGIFFISRFTRSIGYSKNKYIALFYDIQLCYIYEKKHFE